MTQQYSCRSELSSCDCLLQHGARTLATPAVAAAAGLTSSSSTPSAEGALSSSSECTDGSSLSVTHGFFSLESVVELTQTPSLRQKLSVTYLMRARLQSPHRRPRLRAASGRVPDCLTGRSSWNSHLLPAWSMHADAPDVNGVAPGVAAAAGDTSSSSTPSAPPTGRITQAPQV